MKVSDIKAGAVYCQRNPTSDTWFNGCYRKVISINENLPEDQQVRFREMGFPISMECSMKDFAEWAEMFSLMEF